MNGYTATLDTFNKTSTHEIVLQLKTIYPTAQESQIQSWETLIDDVKNTPELNSLPNKTVIAIEYSLPTDGMAIDLMLAGLDSNNQKIVFIVESKQWNDMYIDQLSFSAYREDGKELHPMVQVGRHKLSFCDYLDIGQKDNRIYQSARKRNCQRTVYRLAFGTFTKQLLYYDDTRQKRMFRVLRKQSEGLTCIRARNGRSLQQIKSRFAGCVGRSRAYFVIKINLMFFTADITRLTQNQLFIKKILSKNRQDFLLAAEAGLDLHFRL